MKLLFLLLIIATHLAVYSQDFNSILRVQGYIFSPDSLPVENAYLISYQTLRAYTTDENGKFDLLLFSNDSIRINHLAYKPVVVQANEYSEPIKIYMEYQENNIDEVSVRLKNSDQINMESNMAIILNEVQNTYYYTCPKGNVTNSYAPVSIQRSEVGINIFELLKWIKYKKKQK